MVAVVRRVEDVGIVQDTSFLKPLYDIVHNLVYSLQRSQTVAVKVVVEVDIGLILLG